MGAFGDSRAPDADDVALVNGQLAAINAKLNVHNTSYKIENVSTQVVAGTNYFFHLTGSDGHKYSAAIHVPLPHTGSPAELGKVSAGWIAASFH